MKKNYLFLIFIMLNVMLFATDGLLLHKIKDYKSSFGVSSIKSDDAVLLCNDKYIAGKTQDLVFELMINFPNNEFGDKFSINLPPGFTINSALPIELGVSLSPGACNNAGVTEQLQPLTSFTTVIWGDDDNCFGGLPDVTNLNGSTLTVTLSVSIDPNITGPQNINFDVSGDGNSSFSGSTIVLPCLSPSISSLSNNSPICSNQSLKLGSSLSGTSPFTYTWSGTGSFSAANSASTTVTGSETGNYVLNVTNACGTASASVSALVELTPTLTVNSESICYGKTATLTVSGADTYVWSSGETTSSIIVTPTASVNQYTVTGTALNSCQNKVISSVSVNALPNVNVNSEKICVGQTATLSASGATSYIWSSSETTSDIIVTPSASVNHYTVTGTDANNCQNTSVASVTVNSLPVVSLSTTSLGVQCDDVTNLTLTGGAPLGGIYSGNAVTAGIFNPSSAGVGTHTITYIYTDANNCSNSASDNVQVDNCTGIESANADFFKVYPNPTSGTLIISMTENMSSFELFNLVGEKVLSNKLAKGNNYIDLSHLSKGAYFVKISTTNKTVTKKVVLSK